MRIRPDWGKPMIMPIKKKPKKKKLRLRRLAGSCEGEMTDKKIPLSWLNLAMAPIEHPCWHARDGSEYLSTGDKDWIVTNEKVGPYRVRSICKVVKVVRVKKSLDI